MKEKLYKTMSRCGGCGLTLGIITLITGVAAGTIMIISSAKLLKRRADILL